MSFDPTLPLISLLLVPKHTVLRQKLYRLSILILFLKLKKKKTSDSGNVGLIDAVITHCELVQVYSNTMSVAQKKIDMKNLIFNSDQYVYCLYRRVCNGGSIIMLLH